MTNEEYPKKSSRRGNGVKYLILGIFLLLGFIAAFNSGSSPVGQTNRSGGYMLAFIDSNSSQYASENEAKYNQIINSIEQNCVLDSGQKISDMLVTVQRMIWEDTGSEFSLLSIATVVNERLSLGGEKVRCDEYMAAVATIIPQNM